MLDDKIEINRTLKIVLGNIPFVIAKKGYVNPEEPIFSEIAPCLQKACEKIIDENSIDPSSIKSISYNRSQCEFGETTGEILEVKIFEIKIEIESGKIYPLEEFVQPAKIFLERIERVLY